MKLTSTFKFLIFFFLIISTNTLWAATIISRQPGAFDNSATWEGNVVPSSSDDIIIKHDITFKNEFIVGRSLRVEANSELTGKTININAGATMINNGTLVINAMNLWGTNSTFQNNGTATISTDVMVNQTSFITNNGTLNINRSMTVNLGKIVNAKAATFTIGLDFKMNGGSSLDNYSDLKIGRDFSTNPISYIENSGFLEVNRNLINNSIFKNTFGKIVVKSSFTNSNSGDFTNDHGDIMIASNFINDYSGKFTNNYGLVTTSGNFTNRSKITGSYGGFKIAGHSENVEGASISGYVDITDTSLATNNTGYVDSNRGFIDIQTVTKNSYKAPVNSLPVTFILWKASAKSNQVVLEWQTATEQNSDFFVVERSGNARDFTAVTSIKGAGNSQQLKSYQFTDKSAPQGTLYYRLKQVDFDGSEEYTKIISVENKAAASLQVTAYPNPLAAQNQLHIALNASKNQNLLVQIINGSGQIVYQQLVKDTEASQTITIPLTVTAKLKGLGVVRCLDENAIPLQITKVLFQ